MTSELRQDPTTRDWVVIAPGRKSRPHALADSLREETPPQACPFCHGHEHESHPRCGAWATLRDGGAYGSCRIVSRPWHRMALRIAWSAPRGLFPCRALAHFVAFQPYASAVPFETWIMPRGAQPCFGDVTDAMLDELAPIVRSVLAGLANALDDPDYNAVLRSAPVGDEHREYFVWHLRVLPRIAVPAGFELGSGMAVNPSLPEEAAPRCGLP